MTKLIYLALTITTACVTTSAEPIPRMEACLAQADLWCARAGFPDSAGCRVVYVHQCTPSGPNGTIEADEQAECLAAIRHAADPSTQPQACLDTWY